MKPIHGIAEELKRKKPAFFAVVFFVCNPPPPSSQSSSLCVVDTAFPLQSDGGGGWSQNNTTAEKSWASFDIFLLRTACSRPQLSSAKLLLYIITLLHKESFYLGQERPESEWFFSILVSFWHRYFPVRNRRELFFILPCIKI